MNKLLRWIALLSFLFLGVQWILHDPPDIIIFGDPDTYQVVFNDPDVVRSQLSRVSKSYSTAQQEEIALQARNFPNGGFSRGVRFLSSLDPDVPQSPTIPHRNPRSPPAA
jgi:hypothetical protein